MTSRIFNILIVFCGIISLTIGCEPKNQKEIENGLYLISEIDSAVQIENFKSFDNNVFVKVSEKPFIYKNEFELSYNPDTLIYGDRFLLIELKFLKTGIEKWNSLYDSENYLKPENKKRIGLVINTKLITSVKIHSQNIGLNFTLCHCDYSETELKEIEEIIKIYSR